ncbi:MAG TPA: PKD domain-containing protein [Thermoplasmata archaeon]
MTSSVQPDAAITLSAPGVSPGAISLLWTATNDHFFSNYTIAYSTTNASGPFVPTGIVTRQTTTEFAVGSLSPGATLWWQVTEYAFRHGRATSNVSEVVQPTLAYLTEPVVTSTSITFNWTNNASYGGLLSFQSYTLDERTNGGASSLVATITNETTRTTAVTGLATGTSYSFSLNTTDCIGCGSGSPASSTTSSNTVTAGTLLALSVTISASRPVVDVNQSDLFTCTPSGGQSPFAFEWSVGGSRFVAGSSSFATAFATSPQGNMTCRVTDHPGSQAEIAMTVTVNPQPVISLIVNQANVTTGEPVSFICSVSGGTPTITVGWSFGDGATEYTENGGSATHAYATAGAFVPTCTATDAVGVSVANSTTVTVSSPTASSPIEWFPLWLLAVVGAAVGAALALGVWIQGPGPESTSSEVMSRWVPPVGPKAAMQGTKICPSCGASNASMRRSCKVCGAALPRNPEL